MSDFYNQDAEQYVLSALIFDNDSIDRIAWLESKHFYLITHKEIFETIKQLASEGMPADVITITDANKSINLQYIHDLFANALSSANIEHHARVVKDAYLKREASIAAKLIIEESKTSKPQEVIQNAITRLDELTKSSDRKEARKVGDIAIEYIEYLDGLFSGTQEFKAIKTGLVDVDERLGGGLIGGDLVVIAGRPGMGKTALLGTMMINNIDVPMGFLSLEMTEQQMVMRMVAGLGSIDGVRLRSGKLADEDWPKITHAMQKIKDAPIFISDQSGISYIDVQAEARRLKRVHNIEYLAIDYLQIMDIGEDDENIGFGKITKAMKNLAKELDIPVILLSQFNRGSNQRADQKPRLADLRGSGSIEQDADTVIAPHRNPSDPNAPTELLFLKNRAGSLGSEYVTFIGKYYKFENFTGEIPVEQPKRRGYHAKPL